MKQCVICGNDYEGRKTVCSDLCMKRLRQRRTYGFTFPLQTYPHGAYRLWTSIRGTDDTHVGTYYIEDGRFYTLCGRTYSSLRNPDSPRITCPICKAEYKKRFPATRPVYWR